MLYFYRNKAFVSWEGGYLQTERFHILLNGKVAIFSELFIVLVSHKTWQTDQDKSICFCCSIMNQNILAFYKFKSSRIVALFISDSTSIMGQTTDMQQSLWVIKYESSPNSLDNQLKILNLFLSIQKNFMVKLSLLSWQITNYLK